MILNIECRNRKWATGPLAIAVRLKNWYPLGHMEQHTCGHAIIIMGPTGSGKGTLLSFIRARFPEIHITISCTTRAIRPGEVDGKDYHFISQEQFDARVASSDFLEWAYFGSNRYGTLRSEILPFLERGEMVVADIELQGVEQLRALLPAHSLTVAYVEAGDWEVLKTRALARAPMSEEELNRRYERYLVEVEAKKIADSIIDNSSDSPDPALRSIEALIISKQ